MILANDTMWICSHLLGWCKNKFEQLARRYFHHLMFIAALFLIWTVDHVGPHSTNWVIKSIQVPREFKLATYQFECDALAYWAIRNIHYCMWQNDSGMTRGFSRTCKRGRTILKLRRSLNVVFTTTELQAASSSSNTFWFWLRTLFMKKKIMKAF